MARAQEFPEQKRSPWLRQQHQGSFQTGSKAAPEFVLSCTSFIVYFLPFLKSIRSLSCIPQTFCPLFHFLVFHECRGDAWGHSYVGGDFKRKAFECFLYLEDAEERVLIASAEG